VIALNAQSVKCGCMKIIHFFPKTALIVDVTKALKALENI
jgi:hypothetical protein